MIHKAIQHKERLPLPKGQGVKMQQCDGCKWDYIGYCMATAFEKNVPCKLSPRAGK